MLGMSYEEREIELEAGEIALFYSDGLVEAHDPEGEMFGFPRLRSLVAEHAEEVSLGDSLLEELSAFVGEGLEARRRHHPPYAEAFHNSALNFREPRRDTFRNWAWRYTHRFTVTRVRVSAFARVVLNSKEITHYQKHSPSTLQRFLEIRRGER